MNNPPQTQNEQAASLAHEAEQGAEHLVRSTQRAAQQGLDRLDSARAQSAAALNHLTHDAEDYAHRGLAAMRDGSDHLREKSAHIKDATTSYIQHEPAKSMLMAAATGAALMGLVALFSRHNGSAR